MAVRLHHLNTPMLYIVIFRAVKMTFVFQMKNYDIFLNFAQNIDCGYMNQLMMQFEGVPTIIVLEQKQEK